MKREVVYKIKTYIEYKREIVHEINIKKTRPVHIQPV